MRGEQFPKHTRTNKLDQARNEKIQTARDAKARSVLQDISNTKRGGEILERKKSLKERCERAAGFKKKEEVWVETVGGTGVVIDTESRFRGVVFIKHPHILRPVDYNSDIVHHLNESKEKQE